MVEEQIIKPILDSLITGERERERESYEISFIISLRGIKQMIDKVATVHPNYKKMHTFLEQKLISHPLIFLLIKYFLIHNTC